MPTRKADARTYPTITRAEAEADAWRDLEGQLTRARTLKDTRAIAAPADPPHAKRFYAHLRSFVRTLKSSRRRTRSELYGFESRHHCEGQRLTPSVQNKRTTYTLLVIFTVDGSSHENLQD